ncbi:universal stress protein UspA [Hahella sp. CCB-MM4]|uniref:universal stress protein n=1 Tax=Hahella sp. (strain CCB-MM4) TaxID=1926491 RepID=UPI000B9AB2AB|nr:universal stress protein [Hahella sp. CCB-MM4]OZG71264.1 universal stress protein UspA [Hahella sp. CCB-MM4]
MYSHILVALDLGKETETVLNKAIALQKASSAKLSLVHIIEPISYAYGGDIPMDLGEIQQQLEERSSNKLKELKNSHQLNDAECTVLVGRPESEIHRYAEEQNADLIVVGSHGRHGLQLLLGSTANGVLHGAKCDVLAVRVQQ